MKKRAATEKVGVSLYEAIGTMRGQLDEFLAFWQKKRREDPDNYPYEWPAQEDWQEQFAAWLELKSSGGA